MNGYWPVSFECGKCHNFKGLGLTEWRDQMLMECPICGLCAALIGWPEMFWVVLPYGIQQHKAAA